MKRSSLRRGKPLERSTPLQGGAPLARRTRLRPVSVKRQQENRERRQMAAERWPDGRPACILPGCGRLADDLHEPLTRARGGSITSEDNTVPVCRWHHDEIGLEAEWAYEFHLLVHSWDTRTPAQIAADRRAAIESAWAELGWAAS